ncbi:MAG: glycosyltransferase [Chloroflexi bacterium]|nr:MAG: glycosyltransferase [Chloroflexota bacterium]
MIMLEGLLVLAFALFIALPSLYYAFLAAITLLPRPRPPNADLGGVPVRFAVLIPAHDEELVIARTIAALLRLDYPRQLFSVHLVADNCTDATAAAARGAGACVHERDDPHSRGKGAALNWLLEKVASEAPDIDAFVVMDADSELSPDFLLVMARHLRSGAQAIQALNLVQVSDDRPLIRIRELAFHLTCHLRPLAYAILGASCGLYGNGMCFSTALGLGLRWNEGTVAEDGEFFLRLVRDGHHVALAEGATVRSVMPATFQNARSQAVRWERGRFDHFLLCAGLAWTGVRRRDLNRVAAGLGPLFPPFTVLAAAAILMLPIALFIGSAALAFLAIGSLVCLLFYVLRGAVLGRLTARTVLRILLWAPPYTLWKLWIFALAAFGVGRGHWSRTTRAV